MKNRFNSIVTELVIGTGLYALVFIPLRAGTDYIPTVIDSNPSSPNAADIVQSFQINTSIVLGVSLLCFWIWFWLAGWEIHPTKPQGTWLLVWWLLLFVVVIAAIIAMVRSFLSLGENPDAFSGFTAASIYFGLGIFLYYLASILSSPLRARYRVPGAKLIHHS